MSVLGQEWNRSCLLANVAQRNYAPTSLPWVFYMVIFTVFDLKNWYPIRNSFRMHLFSRQTTRYISLHKLLCAQNFQVMEWAARSFFLSFPEFIPLNRQSTYFPLRVRSVFVHKKGRLNFAYRQPLHNELLYGVQFPIEAGTIIIENLK